MVLCGTWSETSVARSQLTQFWKIPRHRTFSYSLWTPFFGSHDYPLAVEPGSTPGPLVPKKKLREILYLLICSFLPCLSWLLHSRVRKFWRDLWITLYCRWKTYDNRKFIVERRDIRSFRVKYLPAIRAYREEGRPIVYADETVIHSSHTASYVWDDGSGAGLKAPISKGRRLIIVHAGYSTSNSLY